MTRLSSSVFKTTFPQYNLSSIQPQSVTVTKVQSLCNSLSSVSSFARNPSGLLKHSYSNCMRGVLSVLSGLVFSSYLGVHQSVALCGQKDAPNPLENLPSEIEGYTRGELKKEKPNLFECFYTENYKEREKLKNSDLGLRAKAFNELLEIGEKVVEQVKGKDISVVIGVGGSGKSTYISWLDGSKMERKKHDTWAYSVFDVAPNQETPSSSRISHEGSGTTVPIAVQKGDRMLVDMPGTEDTRANWITIANSILLEKIIINAKSASFVITADINSVKAGRNSYADNLDVLMDSLGYSKKELQGFNLNEKGSSPFMVLVNFTKDRSPDELPTDVLYKEAKDSLDACEKQSESKIGHLGYVYSPEKSSIIDGLKALSYLKQEKHDVKVTASDKQTKTSLNEMAAFDRKLKETIRNLKKDCSIKDFKTSLEIDLLPSLKYCEILSNFFEGDIAESFKKTKCTFEEKAFPLLEEWIDRAINNKNKKEAKEVADVMLLILKEIEITPYLSTCIVKKLSSGIHPKTNSNIAAFLNGTVSTTVGIGAVILASPAFGPIAATGAVAGTIAGALASNVTRLDQHCIHKIGSFTKNYMSFFNSWTHDKAEWEYLLEPYNKIFEISSNKKETFLKKRNEERDKIEKTLKEIRSVFSKPYLLSNTDYSENTGEIDVYLISEGYYYKENTSREVKKRAKNPLTGSEDKSREYFKGLDHDLHKGINEIISKESDYFDNLNEEDKDLVLSRIKSLNVSMNRLRSAQNKYMDHSQIKMQIEILNSSVELTNQSLTESAGEVVKKTVGGVATAVYKMLPWAKEDPPKKTSES